MYGYGNPYYFQPQNQRIQPMEQQNQPYTSPLQNPMQNSPLQNRQFLNGKSVDSIDVVKAMDIPLDGSISYFPIADGSAIVTKQLQTDGTSKTIVYRPVNEEKKDTPVYVTMPELEKTISELDFGDIEDIKDELKEVKKELKELKELKNKIKN